MIQTGKRILVTGGSGFIGTNLIPALLSQGCDVLNLDRQSPLDPSPSPIWTRGDILDASSMREIAQRFAPDAVIHMAARTDCVEGVDVNEAYRVNFEGTGNVLKAAACSGAKRVIFTSSQYVCGPQCTPTSMDDYGPHTVYGQSKVMAERIVKAGNWPFVWTIVRLTNIWGPWHMRYRREAWDVIRRGRYLHPGWKPVVRCYGYVENIVHYLCLLLSADAVAVNGKTFYLGDPPIDIYEWVNAFSLELRQRPARRVSRGAVRALAVAGDILKACGISFPITSSRYCSMTQNYLTPMDQTFTVLGKPPVSLSEGAHRTVAWLRKYGFYGEASTDERDLR